MCKECGPKQAEWEGDVNRELLCVWVSFPENSHMSIHLSLISQRELAKDKGNSVNAKLVGPSQHEVGSGYLLTLKTQFALRSVRPSKTSATWRGFQLTGGCSCQNRTLTLSP